MRLKIYYLSLLVVMSSCSEVTPEEPKTDPPEEERINLSLTVGDIHYTARYFPENQETTRYVIHLSTVNRNEEGRYTDAGHALSFEVITPVPEIRESLHPGEYVYRFPTEQSYSIIASPESFYGQVRKGNKVDKQYLVSGDVKITRDGERYTMIGEFRNTANQIVNFNYSGIPDFSLLPSAFFGEYTFAKVYWFPPIDEPDLHYYLIRITNMLDDYHLDLQGPGKSAYFYLQMSTDNAKFDINGKYLTSNIFARLDYTLLRKFSRFELRKKNNSRSGTIITDGELEIIVAQDGEGERFLDINFLVTDEEDQITQSSFEGQFETVVAFEKTQLSGSRLILEDSKYNEDSYQGVRIVMDLFTPNAGFPVYNMPEYLYFDPQQPYRIYNSSIEIGNGTSFETRTTTDGFVAIEFAYELGYGDDPKTVRPLMFLHGRILDNTGEYWDLAGSLENPYWKF